MSWSERLQVTNAYLELEAERLRAELSESRRLLDEARAQTPAICFPRQPNGDGGWVIDANYVAAIRKDCFPIEWQPCEEEVEAVLLAVERAAPVPPQPAEVAFPRITVPVTDVYNPKGEMWRDLVAQKPTATESRRLLADLNKVVIDLMLAAAPVPAQPSAESTCAWSENDDGFYETECGNSFQFIDGGAADNHATYCQYCGKKIDEHWFDDMPEGDTK